MAGDMGHTWQVSDKEAECSTRCVNASLMLRLLDVAFSSDRRSLNVRRFATTVVLEMDGVIAVSSHFYYLMFLWCMCYVRSLVEWNPSLL